MPFRSELFIIYSFNRHTHRFRSHRVKAKFGNQYILNMIDEDALLNAQFKWIPSQKQFLMRQNETELNKSHNIMQKRQYILSFQPEILDLMFKVFLIDIPYPRAAHCLMVRKGIDKRKEEDLIKGKQVFFFDSEKLYSI